MSARPGEPPIEEALDRAVASAQAEGRQLLLEPEGLALAEALGLAVPFGVVADGPGDVPDMDDFPGDRVVVKLLSPLVPHRTELGGVLQVPRTSHAVVRAVEELAARSPDPGARYLIQEFVPHDTGIGGELILGARWSREFGPVVTLGIGGVSAEALDSLAGGGVLSRTFGAWEGVEGRVAEALEGPWGDLLRGAVRGRPGRVAREALAAAVGSFATALGRWIPHPLTEVEFNPLIFVDGAPTALDALVRLSSRKRTTAPVAPPHRRSLARLFLHPRTLGVVGASARSVNPGRVVLRNALAAGMPPERVQVVKAGETFLDGCRCVPNLASLDPVDLLVISVAAPHLPELLHQAVDGEKAGGIVVTTGGVGEGDRGRGVAEAVNRILATPGAPPLNGANCLGIRSAPGRCDTLFIPPTRLSFPDGPPHPVALVSQSGAFAIARANALPWLNPGYLITVGNQLDVTVGEWVEALLDEDGLDVVACYVEGFQPGDGRRFLEAAGAHRRRGRTVVLYRAGRTPEGSNAAASHTASLAGDPVVTRALARDAGVVLAETAQDFSDLVALAVRLAGRTVAGRRLAMVSNAGFECVTMSDALGGLRRADPGPETLSALREHLERSGVGGIVSATNPLDLTPSMDDEGFAGAAALLLADGGVDVGVVACVPLTPALQTLPPSAGAGEDRDAPQALAARLGELWNATGKAWVAVVDAGPAYDGLRRLLEVRGIPVLTHADRAVRLLGRYVEGRLQRG